MDGEWHWRQVRPAMSACRRARLGAWNTAVGIALSAATVVLAALEAVSARQAIAIAVPAVLITVGGMAGRSVLKAWSAWRRGFRDGCAAAMTCQRPAYLLPADDAENRLADPADKTSDLSQAPAPVSDPTAPP
jgi:uncharacterized membrane protein